MITDEIREIGRKVLGVFWDDAPARQIGLAADTFLEAVAPMILEEAAKVAQKCELFGPGDRLLYSDPHDTCAAAIRAMGERKPPLPVPDRDRI